MKRSLIAAGVLAAFANAQPALAVNWIDVLGTEPANAPAFRFFGFVQPTYTYYDADPLASPAPGAGKYLFQNQVQPNFERKNQLQFMRAYFGAKGILKPVSDKINYFVLADAGRNLTTVQHNVMLTDASLTFNFIPGARIRAGLFKLPTGEEALVANPTHFPYVYYSFVTSTLAQETPYQPSSGTGCNGAGAGYVQCAKAVAGNNAFRDWGIQVFDSFTKDKWEFGYAAMISNGQEIENMIGDSDNNKDFTWRLQGSYIFSGKGGAREDVNAFIWRQTGDRKFGSTEYERTREGVGARYNRGPLRFSGEYIRGKGMIPMGPNPPVPNANGLIPPYNLTIAPAGKSDGWYLEGGWKFHPKWELDLRYDEYDRNKDNLANERLIKTWTLGGQYFFNKNTRVVLNYEWRDMEVPNPLSIGAAQRPGALAVADNLADRISLQLTYWW